MKMVVKKLMTVNVERQSIIQVNSHTNEKLLNDCNGGNKKEHRELSHITELYRQQHQAVSQDFPRDLFQLVQNRSSKEAAITLSTVLNHFQTVKSCLMSLKDSAVHPKVQISIICLFKLTNGTNSNQRL